jgi:uncharacterized membrane protein YadS
MAESVNIDNETTEAEITEQSAALPAWKNEDWLAVGLGFLIIILVLLGVRPALPEYKWATATALTTDVFSVANLWKSLQIGALYLLLSVVGIALMGKNIVKYALGFPIVFALSWIAQAIAGNARISYWGIEYVIFALLAGLFISNTIGTPAWLLEAARSEYFIKTGLVILGAGILFQEVLKAGFLGLLQALAVVIVVWYCCFWIARKLKVDDEFAVMLSSAVSICGVSAAIATCGAIQGDKKKLSYVTSLVLIVAIPMIILQPWIVRKFGIPELVGGAWLGGTLDTTGSVVAAGALISEPAMKAGTIVKASQNVLIGVAAFFLSVWWGVKKKPQGAEKPSVKLIWQRFPKFVLGFVLASLVFSFVLDKAVVQETKSLFAGLRTVWFALAFTAIGLETRFTELLGMEGGRPALAFLAAQAVNLIWTLLLAFLLFGGLLFAVPELK